MTASSMPHQMSVSLPSSRKWWWSGFAVLMSATMLRMPVVLDEVRTQVQRGTASGALPQTDQQSLAVAVGVSGAVGIIATVSLLRFTLSRRVESRLKLPDVRLSKFRVPGMVYLVVGLSTAVQLSAFALQTAEPRSEPAVWATAGVLVLIGLLAIRRCSDVRGLRRFAVTAVVVGGVCLVA